MISNKKYQPIENYGVIGDLRTAALVGIDGSIDFMCFPNFNSPSIFAALLDSQKGGFFQITPIEVDASTLLMPLIRFIGHKDPKWLSTLNCIEDKLAIDCLVYRYKPENAKFFGLQEGEGNFSACSFWFIECLSRSGQLQKAQFYFDKMLSYANHLGLYSEQLGPQGEHLGNFPQAFTHLALISAAYDLNKRLNR